MGSLIALGMIWLGATASASLVALVNRPLYADVSSDGWVFLVLFSLPAVVLALVLIRTPVILAVTAALSGTWCAVNSWNVMRDTHSTGAIGVLAVPIFGLVIVGVGYVLDRVWRATTRQPDRSS